MAYDSTAQRAAKEGSVEDCIITDARGIGPDRGEPSNLPYICHSDPVEPTLFFYNPVYDQSEAAEDDHNRLEFPDRYGSVFRLVIPPPELGKCSSIETWEAV